MLRITGFSLLEVLIAGFIAFSVAITIKITLSRQLWQLEQMLQKLINVNETTLFVESDKCQTK